MKVISYTATLPKKEEYTPESLRKAMDKSNTLRYFAEGVNAAGDEGVVIEDMTYQTCDVAVILGWVHEHGKTAKHLQFRQTILNEQNVQNRRTIIADSNLFLYKNTDNPGYWLRYSFDGIFPNTGEYCDSQIDLTRWPLIQKHLGVSMQPWRENGDHILLCLQRDGGWSMAGQDVVDWAMNTIQELRKYTRRPIRIRTHPGDKRAKKYSDRIIKLCQGRRLNPVSLSSSAASLDDDFKNCWAVVNHNSSPGVAAAIEGIPVFVTDPIRSQAQDVANTDLSKIESPTLMDRDHWINRISQFHWSHEELRSGACWQHMKRWATK